MGLIYDRRGAAPSASRSQLGCPPSAEVLHQAAVQGRSRWLGVSVLLTDIEIVLCLLPPLSFGLRSFHVLLSFYCSMRFRVPITSVVPARRVTTYLLNGLDAIKSGPYSDKMQFSGSNNNRCCEIFASTASSSPTSANTSWPETSEPKNSDRGCARKVRACACC